MIADIVFRLAFSVLPKHRENNFLRHVANCLLNFCELHHFPVVPPNIHLSGKERGLFYPPGLSTV